MYLVGRPLDDSARMGLQRHVEKGVRVEYGKKLSNCLELLV